MTIRGLILCTIHFIMPLIIQARNPSINVFLCLFAGVTRSTSALSTSASKLPIRNRSLIPENTGSGPTFPVYDPADPKTSLSDVPLMGRDDAQKLISKANEALSDWCDGTTGFERGRLLTEWSRLINENANDIATIMTLESGKPLKESLGEIAYARSFLDYYAAEAVRPTSAGGGYLVPTPFVNSQTGRPRGQVMAISQAVGVCAMITPWNFPAAMITRKVGPALAAGCTTVVKPSELTPLTAIALKTLADEAGMPKGVFDCVTTDRSTTAEVGTEFCTNPLVQKISFTGSTSVGKRLMELSSGTVKRLSLELGGNAPFVVFEDADLDQAVAAAMASKFRNAGQTCVCADRFLIHASIHDEFVQRLVEKVKALQVGPGMDENSTMGPLITSNAVETIHFKVKSAIADGARCEIGGYPLQQVGPQFYSPTVLTDVSTKSDIFKLESFGPVAAICKFETEEEALAIANDSRVGLASYFCTANISRAFRFAKALECGIVVVNEGIISTCAAPFGGVKESGLGREGASNGIAEYLETKYVFMNV